MKRETSNLTRCLALFLALVMLVSNANLGLTLNAFAAEGDVTVSLATVVADNYDLSEAEKALLTSGYLSAEGVTYAPFEDTGLVTVDTDSKTITANGSGDWAPTTATLTGTDGSVETVDVSSGSGVYTYAGEGFSVVVNYVVTTGLEHSDLLNAAANYDVVLKDLATAYNACVDSVDGDQLQLLVDAMDTLVQLADGMDVGMGNTAQFGEAAQEAVYALEAQIEANGVLDMQTANAAYNDATYKVQYMTENGESHKDVLVATYEALAAIAADENVTTNTLVDQYLELTNAVQHKAWTMFKDSLAAVVEDLKVPAENAWTIPAVGAVTGEDFADLEDLVNAAVADYSAHEAKKSLTVATGTASFQKSMCNVTVEMVLRAVDENNEVRVLGTASKVVTLPEGATQHDVLMAVSLVLQAQQAEWGIDEHFDMTTTELPETLTEDVTYTANYAPVEYAVDFCGEALSLPYGYVLTLVPHADPAKAYDYVVNGKAYEQGEEIVIDGEYEISRTVGKAYTYTDLYSIIADNFGNDTVKKVLTSGILNGNEIIKIRKPDATDSEDLINLNEGVLTAVAEYASDYNGLKWVPYTYGQFESETGDDVFGFGGSNTATVNANLVKVQYRLDLTNYTAEEVTAILELVAALETEATEQTNALASLCAKRSDMGALNATVLKFIDLQVDETVFSSNAAENKAMRKHFHTTLNAIRNNCMVNGKLTLHGLINDNMTLDQYYANPVAIKTALSDLATHMHAMLPDEKHEAALSVLIGSLADSDEDMFGQYREYGTKVAELKASIVEINNNLDLPNEALILDDEAKVAALIAVLNAEEAVEYTTPASPYIVSDKLSATDDSKLMVQAVVSINGKTETFTTDVFDRGTAVPQAEIDALVAAVEAYAVKVAGADMIVHYTATGLDELKALVGAVPTAKVTTVNVSYAEKAYEVVVGGETVTYTVSNPYIVLVASPNVGCRYDYTVNGEVIQVKGANYVLDMTPYIGTLTEISRVEVNYASEEAEENLADAKVLTMVKDENGQLVGLVANMDATASSVQNLVAELTVSLGVTKLVLNNDEDVPMLDGGVFSLQAIINAVMADKNFTNETIIALGDNNGGKLLTASADIYGDGVKNFDDIEFVINLTSVPSDMVTVANGLKTLRNNLKFWSNNGELEVDLTLPEKVYELYLTAVLRGEDIDKHNINAINTEIAVNFFYDYIDTVLNSNATATSFQNTLDMMYGTADKVVDSDRLPDIDLEAYSAYYNAIKTALSEEHTKVEFVEENDELAISITAGGDTAINGLLRMLGVDASGFNTYLGLIKEYQDGGNLNVTSNVALTNTCVDFEAMIIDGAAMKSGVGDLADGGIKEDAVEMVKGNGIANAVDYTSDLADRLESAGVSAVVLLDDIDGDLTFTSATVLDLNGMTVNGNIVAKAPLFIFDSCVSTTDCGRVTGTVSGKVRIIAGNYASDVSAFLMDGYDQVGETVQNCMYTVVVENGEITYVVNADFMYECEGYLPNVLAVASEIALDVAMNRYLTSMLSVDGARIFSIDFEDLVGLICDSSAEELVNSMLGIISLPGMTDFINNITADLVDFGNIEASLRDNTLLGEYYVETAPYAVTVSHVEDGDYMTMGLEVDEEHAKNFSIGLQIVGTNATELSAFFGLLDEIVVDATFKFVDVEEFVYDDHYFNLTGGHVTNIELDLSNYVYYLAIIMANSAEDSKIADAVNARNLEALKAEFDAFTIEDVFTALKALNRNDDFATLASENGMDLELVPSRKEALLEKVLMVTLSGVGKVLDVLDITGTDATLGNIETSYGVYGKGFEYDRSGSPDIRGFGVNYDLTTLSANASVILFKCRLGDVNHDGKINSKDAAMVLAYSVGNIDEDTFFCEYGADVSGDGKINSKDAAMILSYSVGNLPVFPAEK